MEASTAIPPTMGHVERAKARVLTKDQILGADDRQKELLEVPEWGGPVWVMGMSGAERDAFEESIVRIKHQRGGKSTREMMLANVRAKLCARSIVNEDGSRMFTEADVPELGAKSARALDRVFEVAQRLNGMSEDDIEELAGNSD